jgi:spore coat polysaccharide biosynthesis protein SpsF
MVTAILQARMSSSRLRGKVLLDIMGRPMLLRQIERIRRAETISKIVVATSSDPSDDSLQELADSENISVHRGSLDNVFSRFKQISELSSDLNFVRLTGDCPLTDPLVIDKVVLEHLRSGADYTSNTMARTYPRGLDVEVFRAEALGKLGESGLSKLEQEHVTLGFHSRAAIFKLHNVSDSIDNSGLRWTVDTETDFAFVSWVYSNLFQKDPAFTSNAIYSLLSMFPSKLLFDSD